MLGNTFYIQLKVENKNPFRNIQIYSKNFIVNNTKTFDVIFSRKSIYVGVNSKLVILHELNVYTYCSYAVMLFFPKRTVLVKCLCYVSSTNACALTLITRVDKKTV